MNIKVPVFHFKLKYFSQNKLVDFRTYQPLLGYLTLNFVWDDKILTKLSTRLASLIIIPCQDFHTFSMVF